MKFKDRVQSILSDMEQRFEERGNIETTVFLIQPSGDGAIIYAGPDTTADGFVRGVRRHAAARGSIGAICITPIGVAAPGIEGLPNLECIQALVESRQNVWLFEWYVKEDEMANLQLEPTTRWESLKDSDCEVRRFLPYGFS